MSITILKPLYAPENREPRKQKNHGAHNRGYTRAWQHYRLRFLAKHPWCELHLHDLGQYIAATVVDHIQAHKGDMKLFWDPSNHRPLCKLCHDRFGAK
jgi:HNH endonuclease.